MLHGSDKPHRWGREEGVGGGPFLSLSDVNLIDRSFPTTDENDVIPGRFYVGPILPLVQRPPVFEMTAYPNVRDSDI